MNDDSNQVTIWQPNQPMVLPSNANANEIAQKARALTPRDVHSITTAFQSESYEMVSTFVWSKAITTLKKQVAALGMEFVGQMLGRSDINDKSDPLTTISEHDAVSLAEDLGMVTPTEALRLKHAMQLVSHFSDTENASQDQMNMEEAVGILRSCVSSVLGNPHIKPPIQFAKLREALENESMSASDPRITQIGDSPYFIQRTVLSVLLSLLKTAQSAQLEHAVGNTNVIIPIIWSNLRKPEKWQVGQTYAEVHAAGKKAAAIGLKHTLSNVKGFDFVPETLRSDTFAKSAQKLMEAHFGWNNFYNEPGPMRELASLGSTIPQPAFPICTRAILCVKLGNYYGVAAAAQSVADSTLALFRREQWEYYLNECLPSDKTILDKLEDEKPAQRWISLCDDFHLAELSISTDAVRELVTASDSRSVQTARKRIRRFTRR